MDSKEFKMLLKNSNIIHSSLSSNKDILYIDRENKKVRISLSCLKRKYFKNQKLTKKNLTTKRPGADFPANKNYSLLVKLRRNIKKNRLIKKMILNRKFFLFYLLELIMVN